MSEGYGNDDPFSKHTYIKETKEVVKVALLVKKNFQLSPVTYYHMIIKMISIQDCISFSSLCFVIGPEN